MILPVILSGGSGSRLWPLSRSLYPKQFLSLVTKKTLFQDTILRLPNNTSNPIIICNEAHRFLAAEQLREINKKSSGIILEPTGKNTAPAITLAAIRALKDGKDPILLVLSADHLIENDESFHKSIEIAKDHANKGKLVIFGVKPRKPETGYGYIEADTSSKNNYYKIISFKEKPEKNIAEQYIKLGNYYWNSGIFMFKASAYLNEISKFEPEILTACKRSLENIRSDQDFIRLNNDEFLKCISKSIDYAVMEKTKNSIVIPLDTQWSDIGSWASLWESKNKNSDGNVIEGDVLLNEVKNTFVHSSNRLVSAIGIKNLVIVDTPDALLVADQKYSQNISNIIDSLKLNNRKEIDNHKKVYRPWGYYDSIDSGDKFQVKRLFISPGAKISLQKHVHRAEHWIVVKGVALITCGERVFNLHQNQSTYIPPETIHRLENQTNSSLEIIEIQTGDYLGEDDIIRLDDEYDRV